MSASMRRAALRLSLGFEYSKRIFLFWEHVVWPLHSLFLSWKLAVEPCSFIYAAIKVLAWQKEPL